MGMIRVLATNLELSLHTLGIEKAFLSKVERVYAWKLKLGFEKVWGKEMLQLKDLIWPELSPKAWIDMYSKSKA